MLDRNTWNYLTVCKKGTFKNIMVGWLGFMASQPL